MSAKVRILVEFDVRLGDFIIELPILHALRDELRPRSVETIVHARCAGLLEDYDWVERVHVKDGTYRSRIAPIRSGLREPFDLFIYIRRNPAIKLTWLLVRTRKRVGAEHFDPAKLEAGVVLHRYSILGAVLPGDLPPPRTRIELGPHREREAMREAGFADGSQVLCVGPGASTPLKCWPLERFDALVRNLGRGFDAVAVLGSPAEAEMCRQLADLTGGVSLTHLSLAHTAALLSQARLYVGNDSGLSHLAAAQGCPAMSIGLKPEYYRPWNGYAVRGDPAQLSIESVLDALRQESLIPDR